MTAELQQTVAAFAHALDDRDEPALTAILTEDTTWTFTTPARVLGPLSGRTAVLDFIRAGHQPKVRHHLSNILVRAADTGSAEVRAYLLQTRSTGGIVSTGIYTFGMRRAGGGWQISELTLALDNDL